MTKSSQILLKVCAAGILLLGIGWGLYRFVHPYSDNKTEQVSLRLKWLHQAQFAGYYVATQKGFYNRSRLSVAIKPGGSEFPAIPDVAGGFDDFGIAGADQILIARSQGAPVVAIAVIYRQTPMVLFSFATKGITTASDMVGKRVGVKPGGNEELTYRAIVRAAHIDESKIQEFPVKYDMTPLFDDLVDVWPGYTINEVLVAEEKGKKLNIISPKAYNLALYADTLFTTERMIKEHPDTVRRFVAATLEGWRYSVDHPAEAAQATLQFDPALTIGHEVAMMKASISSIQPDKRPIGSMDIARWKAMQELLLSLKFMKEPIDLTKSYDPRFVTEFYDIK